MSNANKRGPRRPPPAAGPGLLIAIALVLLAVIGVHDLVIAQGWASGQQWLPQAVASLDGLEPDVGLTIVGVIVALVGLLLLWLALKPGRTTHRPTPMKDGEVWISRAALGRLAKSAAERTTGVESAKAAVRGRTLKVGARSAGVPDRDRDLRDRIQTNVVRAVEGFSDLRIKISTKEADDAL